jgi:hypothetical protein
VLADRRVEERLRGSAVDVAQGVGRHGAIYRGLSNATSEAAMG